MCIVWIKSFRWCLKAAFGIFWVGIENSVRVSFLQLDLTICPPICTIAIFLLIDVTVKCIFLLYLVHFVISLLSFVYIFWDLTGVLKACKWVFTICSCGLQGIFPKMFLNCYLSFIVYIDLCLLWRILFWFLIFSVNSGLIEEQLLFEYNAASCF